jgi:hypothetical protein
VERECGEAGGCGGLGEELAAGVARHASHHRRDWAL